MKGFSDSSTAYLKAVAEMLCEDDVDRDLLQRIYEIGRTDGRIEQLTKQIKEMEVA